MDFSLVGKEGLVGIVMQAYGMPFLYELSAVFGENVMCIGSKITRKQSLS